MFLVVVLSNSVDATLLGKIMGEGISGFGHTLGLVIHFWEFLGISCVLVFLGWGESTFLIFILGVTTNHWFCIMYDWSPKSLIRFKLPNQLNQILKGLLIKVNQKSLN